MALCCRAHGCCAIESEVACCAKCFAATATLMQTKIAYLTMVLAIAKAWAKTEDVSVDGDQ